MRILLIVAHGSRRPSSNEEVYALATRVSEQRDGAFARVVSAFLELASPSIPAGLAECVRTGATEIVVFPYFLAAGRHVVEDIPNEVDAFRAEHPDVRIAISGHLGGADTLPAAILQIASR